MNILYVGDIMAIPGQQVVAKLLPEIKEQYQVDFTIAQTENSNLDGKGPGKKDLTVLQKAGVDFFTGGNHSLRGSESEELYKDDSAPIIRPANMKNLSGHGWKIVESPQGKILVVCLLGQIVGSRQPEMTNPLHEIDKILEETKDEKLIARIVNFHGDFSSEKRVIGYYLDGKISAVIGDHWHVPSADATILPSGTAHITDVGMCGTIHSSIGVSTDVIVERWKTGKSSKNTIETNGPLQFNAVLVNINTETGLAYSIELLQRHL